MAKLLEEIQAEALRLSPEERETLAGALLHSLDEAPLNEIDAAWIAEAERRYEDWKAGRSKGDCRRAVLLRFTARIGMRVTYHEEARAELAGAFSYYESRVPGLGRIPG